ncbi:MAG: hypothetical protein ACUVSF_06610 [Anaerolineae bacterium]
MKIKLTRRQQAFLDKLFDLYREFGQPVHYSVVAERLGVNRFSAYDMLKTLEEKGVAASAYAPKGDQRGPGRSMVLFYPTYRAAKFLTQLRQEMFGNDEWPQVKERVLRRLCQALESNSSKTLRELLNQLPGVKSPLAYCTEMIGVLLLNLAQCQAIQRSFPLGTLQPLTAGGGPIGLGTLAGLSLGSLVTGQTEDPSFTERLAHHIREFQEQLSDLSEESLNRLNIFLQDALKAVENTRRANRPGEPPSD